MLNALANTSFSPAARSFIGSQAAPILGIATKRLVVDPAVSRRFRMSSVATASTTCDEEDEDVAQEPNPFDLSEKKKWDRARFGKLDHTSFGRLSDCVQMTWPKEHQMHFVSSRNQSLTYRWVDVEKEADDVAGIYQRAIDEMKGNSDYIWHHNPAEIRRLVASGMHSIWGAYLDDGTLVSVNSAEFMLGQRGVHWMWGAVDPRFRGRGVWENVGVFMDKMIEKTGAQYGLGWMATTHNLSQRMIEKVPGWKPVGCFEGGELLGGSDGKYYRQTVIWYSKLFGDAALHTQSTKDMVLTIRAGRVASAVLEE